MSLFKSTLFCVISFGCLIAPAPNSAHGGLMLSLQPAAVDLLHLSIGQTFTVDVILSGLGSGEQLGYVAGTVNFQDSLLSIATDPAPGAIVPDATGFLGFGSPGAADANYDFLFAVVNARPITSNGTLYSFSVVALAAGTGFFEVNVTSLAARDTQVSPMEVTIDPGAPLSFTINSNPNIVPEPSSWIVFGILCLVGGLNWRSGAAVAS